jgi:glycosyltransferase involved in cell wall biosynthesis
MFSHCLNHNLVSWIFFASRAKPTSMRRALAERLAEKETVILVDQPVSILRDRRAPGLRERLKPLLDGERSWHYESLHFPERLPGLHNILKRLNRHRLQQELDQLLGKNTRRIVCYDSPTQDQLVGKLKEDLSIYLAIDDKTLTVWGELIPGELGAEKRLLGKVDKVICVSETLAEVLMSRMTTDRKTPVYTLPNGYDERLFDPTKVYPEPKMLRGIPRPRILVAGHVSERIDWEGIVASSRILPEWTWIFLGPADSGMKERISSALRERGFYHPPIPVLDVPAWINHCDGCAVPYRLNSFTRASHPLKALEYLAMGAPVLSTRIPSLERYNGVIAWINQSDGESYARALDELSNQAASQETRELRRRAVSGDSLATRVDQFREIVFNAIS